MEGTGYEQFRDANGLTLDNEGNVYVTTANHQIMKWTKDPLAETGTWSLWAGKANTNRNDNVGTDLGVFIYPSDIKFDASGNAYVAESGNHRVQKWSKETNTWSSWGTYGTALGEFSGPKGIAIDSEGDLYVAEYGNYRVQKLVQSGQLDITDTTFDKNIYNTSPGNYQDIIVKLTSNGKTLTDILLDGTSIGQQQYIQSGNVITIEKETLANAALGERVFTFNMSGGTAPKLKVNVSDTTPPVPGTPKLLGAIPGNETVNLSWEPVEEATGYKIYQSSTSSSNGNEIGSVTAAVYADHQVTNLVNGSAYYFSVKAINSGVESPFSNILSATPRTVPDAPANVVAIAGNGQASVTFDVPNDGGSPITGYTVTASPIGATGTGTGNTIQVNGLINGMEYTFTVIAHSNIGDSDESVPSAGVTPLEPTQQPSAPTNVTATAGNASATISFVAPVSEGSHPIAGYEVLSPLGEVLSSGVRSPIVVTGLTNGTAYTFLVRAVSEAGNGVVSTISNTVKPIAPSSVSGGGGGGGGVSPIISNNGILKLSTGTPGEASLDDDAIVVTIPSNASSKQLELTIEKLSSTQGLLGNKEILASSVYEILKSFTENFDKPVTITISFNPSQLNNGQTVAIFYFDEVKKVWVEVEGGKISNNRISADVNHFTKFAALVVDEKSGLPVTDQPTTEPLEPTEPSIEVNLSDISSHWAAANIQEAVKQGIVKGYTDGTFKPNATVTRAEFAVMLMNALKSEVDEAELSFSDNTQIGAWAQKAVAQAVQASFINGFTDGTFRPNAELTRAEMAVIIANVLKLATEADTATGFADDDVIPTWAKGAVGALKKLELVSGKSANHFDPKATTTRAEAVTVLLRMLEQESK